ncbi:MAG: STAS-like domain-containing protein [Isosphaeraceae bacterium]
MTLETNARWIRITIADDGVGIFEKIRAKLGLADPREAILELAKGKFTTDPARHSGQGIFFTSRMCDRFAIRSGHLLFDHDPTSDEDWLVEVEATDQRGTTVSLGVRADTPRTTKEIFDQYTDLDSDDYSFSKTHVPISLARYDAEQLVSRSQAKRVLSRFDRFKEVVLDFRGVESIGQAFADEIFRVHRASHPGIKIVAISANESVQRMINRAISSDPGSPA